MLTTGDYELLTEAAGVVERPGRAVLMLEGSEVAEFLQGQVTNDIEALEAGEGCYAALLDHKGKIRTDLRVLRLAPDRVQVDAEPAGRPVLARTFEMYSLGRDVKSRDLTDEQVVLSLVGPGARDVVETAPAPEEHSVVEGEHGLYVSTDAGVDLIVPAAGAERARALAPAASEDAAECLRIESGRPRLGLDMDGTTIPQEAGLNERAVSFTKGCYVGQETVARLHYKGKPNRTLRGLRLSEPAEHGTPIVHGEREVGTVGSTCESPRFGPIALALIRREAATGDEVIVGGANATVVDLPFADAAGD